MKTQPFRAWSATLGGLFACANLAAAFTPTILPQIISPANGSTVSTTAPLVIEVNLGDLPDVQSVEIFANGTSIGWAYSSDFFGEWAFPGEAHLSVMRTDPDFLPTVPPVMLDYHPDAVSPMMFFEGEFVSPSQFSGTFNGHGMDGFITGDLTIDFKRVNGKVNAVIIGDDPVGTREHTGGVLQSYEGTYSCEWSAPIPGDQSLTAKVYFMNPDTQLEEAFTTVPLQVTVTAPPAPEIDVKYAGRSLKDNKSSTGFGKVVKGDKGKALTYTIRNVGTARLTKLKVVVKGSHSQDFLITQPGKSSLAAQKETSFKVRFAPKKTGTRKAELRIFSNDEDENPFRVTLQGTGK